MITVCVRVCAGVRVYVFSLLFQVIYVMRNPRDVFTSYLHFSRMASYLVNPGAQTESLHKFLNGEGVDGLLV